MERLRYEDNSLWRAKQLGTDTHFGWTLEAYLLANLVDGLSARNKGKKLRPTETVPRPKVIKPKRKEEFDRHNGVRNMHLGRLFPDDV